MWPEALAEEIAHVPDNNEDEVAGISLGQCAGEAVYSPHIRGEQNEIWWSGLLGRVDRLVRVPLRRPPPVWVVVVSELAVLDSRLDVDEWLLKVVLVHLGKLLGARLTGGDDR